jgi:hypothetical protein
MADDIDTQLAALEEKAPLTPQPGDAGFVETPVAPIADGSPTKTAEQAAAEAAGAKQEDVPELESLRKKLSDKEGLAASERAKRRAAEAEREQVRQQLNAIQQQMQQLAAQRRAAGMQPPDPEENVVEALKYERMIRMAREREQAMQHQQQAQVNQQINYVNNLKTAVEDFEAEFRETHPEYDEAANWLVDSEQKKLELAGVPTPQAEQMAINWAINMANMMLRQGKNPAQVAWEAANMMGWKPPAATPAVGAAPAAQAGAAAKMAAQKAGQAAAKTLTGGGATVANTDTLAGILDLHGAAFDSAAEKFLRG